MDRNSRPSFAAFAAEEERQKANEEAARERRPTAEDLEGARSSGEPRPSPASTIVGRIRRALGR